MVFIVAQENLWGLLLESLRQIAHDIVLFLPKIFIILIVFTIAFFAIRVLNLFLKRVLKFVELDKIVGKLAGFSLPFSLNTLLMVLADLGITLIALYSVIGLFLDSQYIQLLTDGLQYGARIVSIFVVAIFMFSVFGVAVNKIRVETRLRGYIWFITLLLITAMLMDITALSDPVKNALINGLSMGVGISLGVFAIWFFFHEYLDKILKIRSDTSTEE